MVFKWPSEWRDSDAMSYFISDFASTSVRPSRKLNFWSNLICAVCQYRKTPFVTISELKRCLAWRGVPPQCLEGVLEEMQNKRTVLKLEKLTETWSRWGFGVLASPLTSVWRRIVPDTSEQKFVVVSVLEECRSKVINSVYHNDDLLFTIQEWNNLMLTFVHPSNLENLNNYLGFRCDIVMYGDPVSLVKVRAPDEKVVSSISQVDIAIGKAKATRDALCSQIKQLSGKVNDLLTAARKAKNKNAALAHLRRKKLYERSIAKWEGALNNTESLLLQLEESQHNKTILSTLKVGAEALKQNKVSLNEVDDIMDQLDEYKSYEDDLNSAMTSLDTNVDCDMSLSEELANLLADNSEPPPKKQDREVIDLTLEEEGDIPDNTRLQDNMLSSEELAELYSIQEELDNAPTPPEEFDEVEHPVEREAPPKEMLARLSPELRRKPGRKLVGTLME
ncbi:charged multivesicular body protein 7-like isoform X1 [Bolinopsis microptera]|uniref:charged multivesicular body protein 7-like isoform X1 n=1 Tax=Bolinopsis microptera TaxID=2820187 RepID=UPI0030799C8D